MWIYEEGDEGKFIVGFYDPKKEFHEESQHEDAAKAAHRVHFLNGGTLPYRPGTGAFPPSGSAESPVAETTGDEVTPAVNSAEARRRRDLRRGISSAQ